MMDAFCTLTPKLVAILISVVIIYFVIWYKKKNQYPPGPLSLPIIGNVHNVIQHGGVLEFYAYCQKKFGNVFTVEFAGVKYVVISKFHNVHTLLVKNGAITNQRNIGLMPPSYDIHNMKERPGIMFSPNWREIRQPTVRYLREEGMGKSTLESRVLKEASKFCQHFIEPRLEQEVDLCQHLELASSNVIFSLIIGERFDYTDSRLLENNRMMKVLFESNLKAIMTKHIPFAKWLPGDPFEHTKNADCLGEVLKYFDRIVAKRREVMSENNNTELFVDNCLQYFTQNTALSQEKLDKDMSSTLMQLFGGGTDTSACFMSWALLFMCLHQSVQKKVQAEIDNVLSDGRVPRYSERAQLPYTEAVLLETMRCSMILPTLLPHTLEAPFTIEGHEIPANTELIFNLQTVYNDPDVFDRPEEFNPERFLTGNVQLKRSYPGIVFGIGRRSCPGEPLARMEMFLFFTSILQKYALVHGGKEPPSVKGICGTLNTPKPYTIVFCRRDRIST